MIAENEPITNKFISVPAQFGHLNCAAFVAGIIAGLLDGADFVRAVHVLWSCRSPCLTCSAMAVVLQPARVTAHNVAVEGAPDKTVFLIKFSREALSHA